MSQSNPKYKRLEALFSETKPVQPDPVNAPANQDVVDLKARVSELEEKLTQHPPAMKGEPGLTPEVGSQSRVGEQTREYRHEPRKNRVSTSLQKRSFGLRSKLTFAISATALLAVAALSYFAYSRANQIQTILGGQLNTTVEDSVEASMTDTLSVEILKTNDFLVNVAEDIAFGADYASQLFQQKDILSTGEYWNAGEKLITLPGGQQDNSNSDKAAVFISKAIPLTEDLKAELNTMIHLDLIGPSTLLANTDLVAFYYIDPQGVTIYYPNIDLANLVPPDFDVTSQVFYQIGIPKNNPDRKNVWTPPYQDPAGTGLIVTNVSPIYDQNGKFQGVLAADVQLAKITDHISNIKIGKTGYAFLIDTAGHIIAMPPRGYDDFGLTQEVVPVNESPKQSLLDAGSEELRSIFRKMTQGTNSLDRVDIHGNEYYVAYGQIPATGYSIGLLVPVIEMNGPAIQANNRVAGETLATLKYGSWLVITVLLGSILVGTGFSRVITAPLEKLTNAAQKISAGDLNQNITVTSRDEVGLLGVTFNKMTAQLRESMGFLEQRVIDRTHDLELASEVGRMLGEKVTDSSKLLAEAVEMIRARFHLYYAQIYLTDRSGRTLALHAGTGEVGKQLLRRGHRLAVGSGSINGRAASERHAIIVEDTENNSNFLANPLLPNTRSEMAVPLIVGDSVVGVLDMQSEQAGTLNPTNLPAFTTLAGQLAIAIQNAALFAQAEEARSEMESQVRQMTEKGWQGFLNAIERDQKLGYAFDQSNASSVQLTGEALAPVSDDSGVSVPLNVAGAKIGMIQVANESERGLTSSETEVLQATARQLAQHLENLRLLSQAEQYRTEAEQAVRRLTGEGWESYLQTSNEPKSGYIFDLTEVKSLSANNSGDADHALRQPLVVSDETIGELAVDIETRSEDSIELLDAVAGQLSSHIENLRLMQQAEERRAAVQQGEARLRTLVENAPEAIVVVDLSSGLFTEPNENAVRLYGLSRDELVKVGPAQMSPPNQPDGRDSTEKAMEKINEAMQGGAPVFEWIHRNAQGRDIPCEVRLVRLPGADPFVRASVTDITERKRDQEILAQRANQLETVATLSSTASTVLDPDKLLQAVVDLTKERFRLYHTHIYLADESWNTLLLSTGAGDVGRKMVAKGHAIPLDAEKSLVARAARAKEAAIVNDVQRDPGFLPNPLLPETRSEMAVPMIVGEKVLGVFDVQADTINYFTEEDQHIYTTLAAQVAIALQNARLYSEQAATVTQLRELDRLKSSFLANMSHELRTPLNSILGFADVMLEELDGPLTENMNNDLGLIQKNGQHLLHLINDVLDMAKIESGTMNLVIEKFNLHEVMQEVADITSTLAGAKDLALLIDQDSDRKVEIMADRIRLRQVMINLINNAIKFTDKGQVAIRALQENNHVMISVKDTGIGIPPSQLETVFQEFAQVDSSATRKVGGTGLGLPISKRLIEMHGGRLWAESSGVEGEGATFFVFLPLEARVKEAELEMVK